MLAPNPIKGKSPGYRGDLREMTAENGCATKSRIEMAEPNPHDRG